MAFQSKFRALSSAAHGLAKHEDRARPVTQGEADAEEEASLVEERAMADATRVAAQQGVCLELTIDMQSLAQRLSKADWAKLDRKIAKAEQAPPLSFLSYLFLLSACCLLLCAPSLSRYSA